MIVADKLIRLDLLISDDNPRAIVGMINLITFMTADVFALQSPHSIAL